MASTLTAAPAPALADRQVTIETPEHVAFEFELADLGSRFVALLIDGLIILGGLLVLFVGTPLLANRLGIDFGLPWGFAAVILASFALTWGYFVYFEGLRDGQTPGKWAMGIRAIHDGGYPLTLRGAAVRNLLRMIDIQPVPSWLVGGLAMLIHPRTKRLGDLAAGTIVVRERHGARLPEETAAVKPAGSPRLNPEELSALATYVARRRALDAKVRQQIAARLLERLERRLAGEARGGLADADAFLVRLHEDEAARHAAAGWGASGSPLATALVRRQRGAWDDYRRLLEIAQKKRLSRLPDREVSRFAALYREIAADLARARTYGGSSDLVYSLERWVGAGHNLLYRPAQRSWKLFKAWVTGGFPALVRLRWRPVAVSAALFFLPALLAFAAVRGVPVRAREILPVELIARAEEASERAAEGRGYVDVPEAFMPIMASRLIANNVQVTFAAFAGGVLAGVGTLLVLVFNGVLLGAVAALFANHDANLHLWSFVLPHGVIELSAIWIAGGAGLWLGSALLVPGRRTRREALVVRGREAVSLLVGTTILLVLAGMIEAFVSPAPVPAAVKLLCALVFASALAAYLLGAGRGDAARQAADEAGEL